MPAERALFRRYPALAEQLPIVELGSFPTPVTSGDSLAAKLGIGELRIKRDERCAPVYGGNKVRKLEFLLGDVRQRGCNAVLTYGGAGSNHALATAIYARQMGLRCSAVLTPEPATESVRRTLLYHLAIGTSLVYARNYEEIKGKAQRVLDEAGDACYEIPFGGASWVGTCGFVDAACELADQITAGELPQPDVIYIALGTTGSAAGLALGFALCGIETRIEAVQVTPPSMQPESVFARLFAETNRELNRRDVNVSLLTEPFRQTTLRDDQLGDGYAMPTAECREAAALMDEHLGLPASLTYSAKAMAGLIADARAGKLRDKQVLFWNTYNAQPYPELPGGDAWKKLPPDLHRFFASAAD
jgi:D-cysteine desulfhydrase